MRKRILSLFLLLTLAGSLAVPVRASGVMAFSDLPADHWAYSYVKELFQAGVVDGETDTTFAPQGTVTLGQALKLILLTAGFPEQAPADGHWAGGYRQMAEEKGLMESAASLGLDEPISRQQIAEIAARALGCQRTAHGRSPFVDTANLSVLALSDNGIFDGVQEGTVLLFKPKAPITRAEISAVIWRMMDWRKSNSPAQEPAAEEPPAEEVPGADTPAEEVPGTETPAQEAPGADTPAEETPATDTPAQEEPGADTPAEETPTTVTPPEEAPATDTPAQEPPDWETPPEGDAGTVQPVTPQQPAETAAPSGYFNWRGKQIPIWENIEKNPYNSAAFSYNSNGFLVYDDDAYTCRVGIDVSKYQGTIDWAAVKGAGVDFAILRLGYRGYSNGRLVMDNSFYRNIQGCLDNDIDVGVYFFSQALNYAEGAEEAVFTMDALANYNITYPIVFDWEPYAASVGARTKNITNAQLTQASLGFLETVTRAGWTAMLYQNPTYFYEHLDMSQFAPYPLWLAHYVAMTNFYYKYDIWQYSCTGRVPGISGNVDLNIQLIPKE